MIGSNFSANFILFASPEGVNCINLGCKPQVGKIKPSPALKGRNTSLYRPFRADEVGSFGAMGLLPLLIYAVPLGLIFTKKQNNILVKTFFYLEPITPALEGGGGKRLD